MENLKIEEKEQAEFLVKTDSGYILQMLDASLEHDGCLKVPDGAEALTEFGLALYFWKPSKNETWDADRELWLVCDKESGMCDFKTYISDSDVSVVWKRHTQPEELPFIDDEPKSLNDQYAEIEAVRQTAFDMQISGNHYKLLPIQPMKFALANGLDYAQGNVIKYVIRHASKGGKEDLLKAIHNIELMIQHYYGDQ